MTDTTKWKALIEIEVEAPSKYSREHVTKIVEGQVDSLGFGENRFWSVTERRVFQVKESFWSLGYWGSKFRAAFWRVN